MKISCVILALMGFILLSPSDFFLFINDANAALPGDKKNPTAYEVVFDELLNLAPDPQRVAAVKELVLQREAARFTLQEGRLCLMRPVRNRTMAAMFTGKGLFSFSPPTAIEQDQLYRFYETKVLQKEFKILFLIFADSTLEELEKNCAFAPQEIPGEIKGQIKNCLDFLSDKKGKYFDADIMQAILNEKRDGLFYAHIAEDESSPLFFRINPGDVEEVSLQRRAEISRLYKVPEVVSQFHREADYASAKDLSKEEKDVIEISAYTIESTIDKALDFSAKAEVKFKALQPDQKWIPFRLFYELEVDSVIWSTGAKATFFKEKDNGSLWLQSEPLLAMNEERSFTIWYRGDLIERRDEWLYIRSPSGWYPRYGYQEHATFDLTFHTPKDFIFVSVGDNLQTETEGEVLNTRWVTPSAIRNASFNIGYFKKHEIKDERIPPATVLMYQYAHRDLTQALSQQGVLHGKKMEQQVGADVANSLLFFQEVFGKLPMKHFYATEISYRHGEAFPGLIHLSWTTFYNTSEYGYDEVFRAHEVAHQWWGIGVDFQTYHDQWLSEGISTFAGLWYRQAVLHDNKKYFDHLKEYRKAILGNRKWLFGSGQEAGPIWLGYRTGSSSTEGDYDLIIYRKGAWVLHMLRNMMIDLKTMNEDRFSSMLRDFYGSYSGKRASTEDFQKIVEKHAGMDMDWFFKQWIYGAEIPEYRFSYKLEQKPDGKYLAHCKIDQREVPDDFQMTVPVLIDFGKNRLARVRVAVKGPFTQVDLPLLPMKPERIVFNDLESVLCEVKEVDWKE